MKLTAKILIWVVIVIIVLSLPSSTPPTIKFIMGSLLTVTGDSFRKH